MPRPGYSAKRIEVWKHNSFGGHAVMMRSQLRMLKSSTITNKSRAVIEELFPLVERLRETLKERLDG